jgi:hypothetical protein
MIFNIYYTVLAVVTMTLAWIPACAGMTNLEFGQYFDIGLTGVYGFNR